MVDHGHHIALSLCVPRQIVTHDLRLGEHLHGVELPIRNLLYQEHLAEGASA